MRALILLRSGLRILMENLTIFDSYLPVICPYFHFRTITLVNVNGFSPNLVCALIFWRSALELLMGKFCQFLTVICLQHIHILVSGQ